MANCPQTTRRPVGQGLWRVEADPTTRAGFESRWEAVVCRRTGRGEPGTPCVPGPCLSEAASEGGSEPPGVGGLRLSGQKPRTGVHSSALVSSCPDRLIPSNRGWESRLRLPSAACLGNRIFRWKAQLGRAPHRPHLHLGRPSDPEVEAGVAGKAPPPPGGAASTSPKCKHRSPNCRALGSPNPRERGQEAGEPLL